MKKLIKNILLTTISAFALTSCGESKTDANTIRVGVMTGPEFEVAQVAKKVAKEKYNLDVELITFNDYIVPNEALNNGDLDVNAYQTVPFLEEQEKWHLKIEL